ncbi:MAG: LacI family DNA-binding transcriptional regulator [Anaerolineae bacterium]|nr:LacI family DNA-binding transcriptional regulator [Anaerolineae bacterium]
MKGKITIRDVAIMAQVSNQTVSRVINNRPDVAEETRQRVRRAIEELNYQPNAIARSLIQQRSLTLGVITAGLQFLGPSQTLNGIAKQAEEIGYSLLLKELPHFRSNNIEPLINTLLARQVEGIIWAVPEIGDNRELLPEVSIPSIYLTMQERPDVSTVAVDNYLGGRIATQHLIDQGYRRIAHLTGPLDWWESRQRKAGWLDTLRDAGLPVSEQQSASGNWSVGSGAQAMEQLVESFPDMDAVFVGNDQMALGAMHVAHQKGYRIPEDLGVVGFDGIPEAEYFVPPLTTISQDLRELGSTAVRQLTQAIGFGHLEHLVFEPRYISLRPELCIRESSTSSK